MPVLAVDDFGARIQALRPGASQTLAVTAASAATLPFTAGTSVVRLVATAPCFVAVGSDPVATAAAGLYLPQGVPEYFHLRPGDRVAAVRAGIDGQLHLSEMG